MPVIYAFVENAAFCARVMFQQEARVSCAVLVRHGGGCGGGGFASGAWMLGVLDRLGCEVFVSDGHHRNYQSGDRRVVELYPEMNGKMPGSRLVSFRTILSSQWSGHGNVVFFRVGPRRPAIPKPSDGFIRPILGDICRLLGNDTQQPEVRQAPQPG